MHEVQSRQGKCWESKGERKHELLEECMAVSLAFAGAELSGAEKPKPRISLTLIPPSPVTDQIALDIRAAVWNRGNAAKSFKVSCYLDQEDPSHLLHHRQVDIEPKAAGGISFRWPIGRLARIGSRDA